MSSYSLRKCLALLLMCLLAAPVACGRDYSGPAGTPSEDTGVDSASPDAGTDTDDPGDAGAPDVSADTSIPPDDTGPVPDAGPVERVLRIAPTEVEVFVGETAQFRALLIEDSEVEDVTAEAAWGINSPDAEVIAPGRVIVSASGDYVVTVQFEGLEVEATLTASNVAENLVDIAITPGDLEVPEGFRAQLRATGLYDNGVSRDISALVQWTSQSPAIFTVDEDGSVEGLSPGAGQVSAALEGIQGFGLVTVVAAELETLEIIPRTVTVPAGDQARMQALGGFSNGELIDLTDQVSWRTADPDIATFSREEPGVVQGLAGGVTTATASLNGVEATARVTITEAEVIQLSITPPVVEIPAGGDQRLFANAVLSDNVAIDVTTEAVWVSDDPTVAELRQVGETIQLASISAGTTTVRATYGGVTATARITVTPAVLQSLDPAPARVTIPAGNTRQLFLVGTYSDASRVNLTFQSEWRTSNADVAIVGNLDQAGFLTARSPGQATITATIDGQSVDIEVTVTDAVLVGIQITPAVASVPAGDSVPLSCFGVYSDNSLRGLDEEAAWSSANEEVAIVSNAPGERGLVTGGSPGTVAITARFEGFEDTARITITEEVVTSIFLLPPGAQIIAGRSQRFNAFATYSNGSTQVVSDQAVWTSNRAGVAQVSNAEGSQGNVTGIEPGRATISASFSGQTGEAQVRVIDAVLEQLFIFPEQVELSPGTSAQVYAVGIYSNGQTRQNLTFEVRWTSDDEEIATVENFPRPAGLVRGQSPGTANITGEVDGVSASTRVRVIRRELVALNISPPSAILPVDAFQLFTALAEFDDGTTQDVTNDAAWTSSDAAIVAPLQFRPGLVSTLREGEAEVSARFSFLEASTQVVVRQAEPTAIIVSPVNPILTRRGREPAVVNFYATAVYPDDSTSDVTQLCSWSSSDPDTILIFDELGGKGTAFGLTAGSTQITARCGEFEASTVATVR